MKKTPSALALALLLISTACSEGEDSSATTAANTTMAEDMDMGDDGHMEEFAFGDPMDASTSPLGSSRSQPTMTSPSIHPESP